MNARKRDAFKDFFSSGSQLPTLSPLATRLIELASDDTCSIGELVRLIENDPALAVRLLKLANSAFFRSLQPVTTLKQAVLRIGLQQLRVMGLSLSLRETFPIGRAGGFDYERFWRISLYRALLARSIAQKTKGTNPDEAFTAGVILEIGLLLFHQVFCKAPQERIPLASAPLEELIVWEQTRFGWNHREVGEEALRHWKFPENMIACQRLCGIQALGDECPQLVRVCEMARRWSEKLFLEPAGLPEVFPEAFQYFGLSEAVVNEMIVGVFSEVEEIAQVLNIELDREKDLFALMEKANQALVELSAKVMIPPSEGLQRFFPTLGTLPEGTGDSEAVHQTLQAVSHEIRNPLSAVAGFARRLSKALDADSDGGRYAQIILQEAMKLEAALIKMNL